MAQIKVNGTRYEASLMGNNPDRGWDGRHSVSVRLALPYSSVIALLPGNAVWSLVQTGHERILRVRGRHRPPGRHLFH